MTLCWRRSAGKGNSMTLLMGKVNKKKKKGQNMRQYVGNFGQRREERVKNGYNSAKATG